MALNQRDLFARAFALRRALTTRGAEPGRAFQLNGCDALLLSLILDQERIRSILIREEALAAALSEAFEVATRLDAPLLNLSSSGEEPRLHLIPWGAETDMRSESLVLVYAMPAEVPLAVCDDREPLWLVPLAFTFPAAWSSRMAWLAAAGTRQATARAQRRLAELLPPDELDPLFLLDALQSQRGREDFENVGAASRVKALEQRVRELETSGLVRYQTLLGNTAQRRRHEP